MNTILILQTIKISDIFTCNVPFFYNCRALGATVVGTAGTKDGMDVVTKCGAHHVFNHNHKNYEKKMVEHIGGEGFDVIIEHLANINLGHDVQMLKEG